MIGLERHSIIEVSYFEDSLSRLISPLATLAKRVPPSRNRETCVGKPDARFDGGPRQRQTGIRKIVKMLTLKKFSKLK